MVCQSKRYYSHHLDLSLADNYSFAQIEKSRWFEMVYYYSRGAGMHWDKCRLNFLHTSVSARATNFPHVKIKIWKQLGNILLRPQLSGEFREHGVTESCTIVTTNSDTPHIMPVRLLNKVMLENPSLVVYLSKDGSNKPHPMYS